MGHTQNGKKNFLAEITKAQLADHQLSESFYFIKISYALTEFTAVLAENDTCLTENITEDRKKFTTQSKHMIF